MKRIVLLVSALLLVFAVVPSSVYAAKFCDYADMVDDVLAQEPVATESTNAAAWDTQANCMNWCLKIPKEEFTRNGLNRSTACADWCKKNSAV